MILGLTLFFLGLTLSFTSALDNSTGNYSENNSMINDAVNVSSLNLEPLVLKNIFPTEIKLGDSQLNLEFLNNGSGAIENIIALISGEGYSTYNVIPIDSLSPGEKSYVILSSRFSKTGDINLTIKANNQIFYRTIKVYSESSVNMTEKINTLTVGLNELKDKYTILEEEKSQKGSENYDVSQISLSDLKSLIRQAQEALLEGDYNSANAKYNLALDEYAGVNEKLTNVKKISFASTLKNNSIIFSTIAGALIAFFTLYEILKKKNQVLKEKLGEMKIKEKILKK